MAHDPFDDALGRRRGADRGVPQHFTVTNPQGAEAHAGRAFTLHVVAHGESYGVGGVLTNDNSAPLVEVFDATYAGKEGFEEHGQLIGNYFLSTLLGMTPGRGLDVHGGVPAWTIDGEALREARGWMVASS
jgi:hypothetical protein